MAWIGGVDPVFRLIGYPDQMELLLIGQQIDDECETPVIEQCQERASSRQVSRQFFEERTRTCRHGQLIEVLVWSVICNRFGRPRRFRRKRG